MDSSHAPRKGPNYSPDVVHRPQTIADMIYYLPTPVLRQELEVFRVAYERIHGPTDLSRTYTTMLPDHARNHMRASNPLQFFQGMAPFAQDFVMAKLEACARIGDLDDCPDDFLALYAKGHLRRRAP